MAEQVLIDPEIWDLVPDYLEHRRGDLRALRAALTASDLATVRKIGHTLRGSGASYGFRRISQLGRALEQSARDGKAETARGQVEEFASHLAVVEPKCA